jgi:hypothetical protein
MFGHHQAKRAKKRLNREKEDFSRQKREYEAQSPEREKAQRDKQNQYADESAERAREQRKKDYEYGNERHEELMRNTEGLDPAERKAMQYEANKGIQRSTQAANRHLLGDQASRGIVGKGGVGYQQQRDLQRLSNEAQRGVSRDLDKLNSDVRYKKLASKFAFQQGESAQSQLDKQMALDELKLEDERKRQRQFEDQFYSQWIKG